MNTHTTLKDKTVFGVIWNFLQQISRYGIQALTTFILAWFLVPEDFGLIAMIAVFFSIANSIMDSGFSQALIRKKEITQVDFSTAFFTNIVLGLIVYSALFAAAPFIASFYNEPRLVMLVRVIGLVVIINSFQMVQVAVLSRQLDFKKQFSVVLPAALSASVIAIILAMMGFGVWSLIAQMILMPLVSASLYWAVNTWRPSLEFSFNSFRELFGFGSNLMLSGIIDTIYNNMYVIVIAKLFSATLVGYYYFAYQIESVIVMQLSSAVQTVSYPVLATLQDDNQSLRAFYRKIIQVVTYFIFPIMIGLAILADPLFRLLLKPDWLPAVPYLQLLCMVGLVYPLHAINLNILKVKGRSDLFLFLEIVKKGIMIVILFVSIPFGIFGILCGQIIGSTLCYLPNCYYSTKLIEYPFRQQLMDFIPTLIVSVLMGIIMYAITFVLPFAGIVYIFVASVCGFVFYAGVNYLLKNPGQLIVQKIIKEHLC